MSSTSPPPLRPDGESETTPTSSIILPATTTTTSATTGIPSSTSTSASSSITTSGPDLRSPSPKKHVNLLGLRSPELQPALESSSSSSIIEELNVFSQNHTTHSQAASSSPISASSSSTQTLPSVLETHPHLGHYVFGLLQQASKTSPTRAGGGVVGSGTHQHPLSVSSSGESDDDDHDLLPPRPSHEPDSTASSEQSTTSNNTSSHKDKDETTSTNDDAGSKQSREEKEDIVRKVIKMLDNEEEEEVKDLLRVYLGELGEDDILMEQVCLDCMHRHRDDTSGVPYASHLTPSRPRRPYTPSRVPSFRTRTPLGRQSPAPIAPPSGTQTPTGHHIHTSSFGSSSQSPILAHTVLSATAPGGPGVIGRPPSSSGYSSTDSPIGSPRLLNAKAATFNPSPRTAASPLSGIPASFSPSDAWKDAPPPEPLRSASPYAFGGTSMARTSSNLVIAAPLLSDPSSPFHSPIGTPNRQTIKMPDVFNSPTSVRTSSRGVHPDDDDDDDDEFSPFGTGLPKLNHHHQPILLSSTLNISAKAFEPTSGEHFSATSTAPSSFVHSDASASASTSYDSRTSVESSTSGPTGSDDDLSLGPTGMTPLDVLSSVFSTVPRSELEDALHRAGYDFEGAMSILVAQYTQPRSGASTPQRVNSPRPLVGVGGRGALPAVNLSAPREGYFQAGGRGFAGATTTTSGGSGGGVGVIGAGMGLGPGAPQKTVGPVRMCRYYLAGECRRSDCRYSHDLERALCRFWLRGHCAKGPNCEFLHHLPNNLDANVLNSVMGRLDVSSPAGSNPGTPPVQSSILGPQDDFPDLLAARLNRTAPAGRFDPARNRFANAVKRAAPGPIAMPTLNVTGGRGTSGPHSPRALGSATSGGEIPPRPIVPKPSNRIQLRPPTLLPTLKTGKVANEQYMAARATAIRLGHARNACLARAADAFRRGDGAAAKRFSREGKALNEKMLNEGMDAAQVLVKERMKDAQLAVRERDPSWSDDPSDRSERGKECAGGLGVILGVASKGRVPGGGLLGPDERLECLIDLHTLHGTEGADIAGQFLAELEREHYRGLAYLVVGEEKHVGTQDELRGSSKIRLGSSVKQMLVDYGYPWIEVTGAICVDPCRT